jgi:transcriptional regulator with XRE-family HTH domain
MTDLYSPTVSVATHARSVSASFPLLLRIIFTINHYIYDAKVQLVGVHPNIWDKFYVLDEVKTGMIMYNGQRIKELAEKRKVHLSILCTQAGIKKSTFWHMIGPKGNPSADKLAILANILECSVDDFFDRSGSESQNVLSVSVNGNHHNVISLESSEITHLKELVREKERTIQILLEQLKHPLP